MLFDKTNSDNPWRKDNCAYLEWCCPDRPDWQKYCEFDEVCTNEGRRGRHICHINLQKKQYL